MSSIVLSQNNSLDCKFWRVEVQKQTKLQSGCLQVRPYLCKVDIFKGLYSFKFESMGSYNDFIEKNFDFGL